MAGLCVRLLKDERFRIGTRYVRVAQIKPSACILEVEGPMKQQYEVTTRRPVELMPNVTATVLDLKPHRVEIQIVAPPAIRIERLKLSDERFSDI